MKKKYILVIVFLMLFGCSQPTQDQNQFKKYYEIKSKLMNVQQFDTDVPFQVSLVFNALSQTERYDIIIDQPTVDMYDIEAMAFADENNEQICPTIGIFDQETYSLKIDYINKNEGFYKGIQLSGECLKKQPVKVYISYYNDELKQEKVEKYIEVNEDEIR